LNAGTTHLVTTSLEETWPAEGRLLFLGPWRRAFDGRASARDASVVADPWPTLESQRRAYEESLDLFERLLPPLGVSLNSLHGTDFSPRFWRILIGPWLIRYVQVLKDRHARLASALRSHPDLLAGTLDPSDRIVPADTMAFVLLSLDDAYNLQLTSALIDRMGIPARVVRRGGLPDARGSTAAARRTPKDCAAAAVELAWRLTGAPVLFYASSEKSDALALSVLSGLKARQLRAPAFKEARTLPSSRRRGRLAEGFAPRSEFERLLADGLADDLPTCFVEFFPGLLASARRTLPSLPRAIVSANGWTYDETFKAAAALAAERGTRLIAVQHGGGYGLYGRIWQEYLERSCADSYWCWGWAELDGDPRLRDMPAPSLSFPPDDGAAGEGLLLVGTYQSRWRGGFQSQAQSEQFERHLDARAAFVRALPPALRARTRARLSPHDMGWEQAARLRAAAPEIAVEPVAGPLHERLRRAALAVFDHPATSFLEAFALDRPLLLFWDPAVWDERPAAKPLLDALRRARVLHDEPLSAAREAVTAMADPRGWWSRREAREAVGAFRKAFALGSADWRRRWAASLKAAASSK